MANEEHLDTLKKGVEVWDRWRLENFTTSPKLSGADLSSANLAFAYLKGADLSGAKLVGATLREAYLSGADLRSAVLVHANLGRPNLRSANLSGADLRGADFGGADLASADLAAANLSSADLTGAILIQANLDSVNLIGANLAGCGMASTLVANVDLGAVKGLEGVRHYGPSTVGIDTIYRSQGKIPEVFLRGAAVPEPFITHMHALVAAMEPIQFYSCFISYSTNDQEFAERLYADLQSKAVRCWFAPEDLKIGDKFRAEIDEAIRVYDKLLLVLSESSVKSPWVEKEVETAFEKENKQNRLMLFPIRLDNAVMDTTQAWAADIRRIRHIGDFSTRKDHDRYKKAFDRLLRDLKADEKQLAGLLPSAT